MLTYVEGDLFTSPAQVLVNTVNTVGVMGKGIAKEFKQIYPDMFRAYRDLCERGELTVGRLFLYRTPNKWILNFPTKRNWRQRSRIEDIEAGLRTFVARFQDYGLLSVAFPQLGCGNGELDWETQVRPLMERYLAPLPIDVYIHIYVDRSLLPEHRDRERMQEWLRSEPGSLPFGEVWQALTEIVRRGEAPPWQIVEDEHRTVVGLRYQQAPESIELEHDDLFDLWHSLRTFGFLSALDVPLGFQPVADKLLDLLERLPYVRPGRFVSMVDRNPEPTDSVADMLDRHSARGVRIVPPAGQAVRLPILADGNGAGAWTANPTTRQLQLSSMS